MAFIPKRTKKKSALSDQWQTPQSLYDFLDKEYGFLIDACATAENTRCLNFFKDCLAVDWKEEAEKLFGPKYVKKGAIFMNPPYSDPELFLQKAWESSKGIKVVCLVSNSIITCKYIDFLDKTNRESNNPCREFVPGLEIKFLRRRTNFYHPKKRSSSPTGGCMLLIMDRRNVKD